VPIWTRGPSESMVARHRSARRVSAAVVIMQILRVPAAGLGVAVMANRDDYLSVRCADQILDTWLIDA
jgi:hypothetical protein